MRYLFYYIPALFLICAMLQGCGHTSTHIDDDTYAETISWTEGEEIWGDEELSDSELAESEADTLPMPEAADTAAQPAQSAAQPAPADAPAGELTAARPGRLPLRRIGRLHEVFNDSNHSQLAYARRLGISPIASLGGYYNTSRPIVKVATCKDFVVDELRHSYPYLVPEAATLLHDIGRSFSDSVKARGGGNYRIIVTSVLRSPSTVKRLRRVNRNATQESTHQYATTFDITYTRFNAVDGREVNTQEDLKNLLGEIIYEMRSQGRCMVKYERRSPCFHITVAE